LSLILFQTTHYAKKPIDFVLFTLYGPKNVYFGTIHFLKPNLPLCAHPGKDPHHFIEPLGYKTIHNLKKYQGIYLYDVVRGYVYFTLINDHNQTKTKLAKLFNTSIRTIGRRVKLYQDSGVNVVKQPETLITEMFQTYQNNQKPVGKKLL